MSRRPSMTKQVKHGLAILAEFGRSYMESDLMEDDDGEDFYPSLEGPDHDKDVRATEAALKFIEEGGLESFTVEPHPMSKGRKG